MKRCGAILTLICVLCLTGCATPVSEGAELLEKKEYKQAVEKFTEAIDEKEDLDEAYRGKGIAQWELKDYEGAKDSMKKALENGAKETAVLYQIMGDCDMELKNYEDALSNYLKGMSCKDVTEKQIQEMSRNEIAAYEYLGDWGTAKAKMRAYVEQYPDDETVEKEAEFLETR